MVCKGWCQECVKLIEVTVHTTTSMYPRTRAEGFEQFPRLLGSLNSFQKLFGKYYLS